MSILTIKDHDQAQHANHGAYILLGDAQDRICAKIGMSSFIETRIASVCQLSPFRMDHAIILVTPNRQWARTAEGALHRMLRSYKVRGEWFMFDPAKPAHKMALHTAISTVDTLYDLHRITMPVSDLLRSVAKIRSAQKSEAKEMKRVARELSAKAAAVHRDKRDALMADRRARAIQYEMDSKRQMDMVLRKTRQ